MKKNQSAKYQKLKIHLRDSTNLVNNKINLGNQSDF